MSDCEEQMDGESEGYSIYFTMTVTQ